MKKRIYITTGLILSYFVLMFFTAMIFRDDFSILAVSVGYYIALYYAGNRYYEKAKDYPVFKIGPEMYAVILIIWIGTLNSFEEMEYWFFEADSSYLPRIIFRGLICSASFIYLCFETKRIYKEGLKDFFDESFILKLWRRCRLNWSRRKYKELISVMEQMAAGNLDVELPKRLGKLEGLREPFMKLREGVDAAATEKSKSERMRVELITNVSHDLKTPLTAIITYIDLLRNEKLDEAKRKEYLDILMNRSERLKFLIEDLFEVSKAASGNVKFEPVEMDLVNLLKQVVFEYEDKLKKAELEVVYEFPEGRAPIFADPQKTYRVYSNLIGNAAKYSLRNSRLYIQVTESEKEIMAVLRNTSANRIRTNGTELTERFVRGDESRNTEGSGLGLAIAKNFTELQGGSLDIIVDGDLFKAVTLWKKYERQGETIETPSVPKEELTEEEPVLVQSDEKCDNEEKKE